MYQAKSLAPLGAAALLLPATAAVWAGNDPSYPAYDFQPEVIYQSPELGTAAGSAASSAAAPDRSYPAADFQPQVIYRDEAAISKSAPAEVPAEPPPAPAAVTPAPPPPAAPVVQAPPAAEPAAPALAVGGGEASGSGDRLMVLALAAALLGFAFTRKGSRPAPPAAEVAPPAAEPAEVGGGEETST